MYPHAFLGTAKMVSMRHQVKGKLCVLSFWDTYLVLACNQVHTVKLVVRVGAGNADVARLRRYIRLAED